MRWRMRLAPATPERTGAGLRHLIPPRVADAVIAVAVAVLGLASEVGARAQHEHMPLAAIPVLTAMGLVLYPRRRYPAEVLAAVAAGVVALVVMHAALGGSFLAVLCACYSAAVYGSRRLVIGLVTGAVAAVLLIGIPQSFGYGGSVIRAVPVPTILAAAGAALFGAGRAAVGVRYGPAGHRAVGAAGPGGAGLCHRAGGRARRGAGPGVPGGQGGTGAGAAGCGARRARTRSTWSSPRPWPAGR
jgi:hypothetical protein